MNDEQFRDYERTETNAMRDEAFLEESIKDRQEEDVLENHLEHDPRASINGHHPWDKCKDGELWGVGENGMPVCLSPDYSGGAPVYKPNMTFEEPLIDATPKWEVIGGVIGLLLFMSVIVLGIYQMIQLVLSLFGQYYCW